MAFQRPKGKPYLEVQIHPSDIRRGVWYLFFTRGQMRSWVAGGLAFFLFLLFSAAVAPTVLSNWLSRKEYRSLVAEREQQGNRLDSLNTDLSKLHEESERLHLVMTRIYLAYGLSSDMSVGQGGYPTRSAPVSDSIYASKVRHGNKLEAQVDEQLKVLEAFMKEIQDFELAHGDQVSSTPSMTPLRGGNFVLTSPFGTRRSPFTKAIDFHAGIDLAAPTGTAMYAPADGVVVFAGRYPLKQSVSWWRYGNMVSLRNGDRFITLFGHCDEVKVRTGQRVKQGQVIATVGNTGWSTSSHLHYEVRRKDSNGQFIPVDPRIYILDHKWRDEEELLVRARSAPAAQNFEPLPRIFGR